MKRLPELVLALLLAGCQTPLPTPAPPPAPACPEPPAPPPEVEQLKDVLASAEQLRQALALNTGRGAADLAQAAAQVEAAGAAEPLRPLAALLAQRLAEQRRLQDSVDKLTQQLRDAQRRSELLNEKLEALKAIEQALPAKR